ncbi:MAG: hypothetical protein B6D37_05035 [Sphingobacteriales bacterium UTBCD1]|jgi:hypothetical protein|nr:MAG: hypothetical protein B6D37_05035 [Sphingobacteriales bacterium UTBCD1]
MTSSKTLLPFLLISQMIISSAYSQSLLNKKDTSSQQSNFLWFTGYWKSKNVFATKSYTDSTEGGMIYSVGGGGSNITVTNDGQAHLSSAQADEWNKKIDDGLNNLKKFEDQLNAPDNTMNQWGNHLAEVVVPELEDLKQNWQEEKINTKTDILNPDSKEQQQANAFQKFASSLTTWCNETKPKYDAIISFYQAHKKDKESDLQNPAPPEFDYQCIACDTNLAKQHDQQTDDYVEKFFKPEADLMRDALEIERNLMLLGVGEDFTGTAANVSMDNDMAEEISKDFSKKQNGACSYIDDYQLNKAIHFLAQRMYARAKKLFKDYKNNMKTAPTVIATLLKATRNIMLMGFKADEDGNLAECAALIEKVLEYYSNKLFQEHDWSQLANIPFLIGLERQRQLLGSPESDLLQKLIKLLNGFHLQIEMDVKLGRNNGYVLAHLKGEEKIAPEFDYVNDTCYRWVLVDGVDPIGFPKKKNSQQIECDLLTNEIVAPGPRPEYIGTRKYYTMMYGLKMDYCHPGQDSIFLSNFIPVPNAMAGKWRIPGSPPIALQINGTDGVFRDIKKMKEMVNSGEAKKGAEEMKAQGEKLIAQMKSLQQQMGNGHNATNLAAIQKMQDLASKSMSLGETTGLAPALYIDFPLQIQNNNIVLVAHDEKDKRFDAKKINPKEAPAIVYGYYSVKVIYKPDNK